MNSKFVLFFCLVFVLIGCGDKSFCAEPSPESEGIYIYTSDLEEKVDENDGITENLSEQIIGYAKRPYVYGVPDKGILFLEEDGTLYFSKGWENIKLEKVEGRYLSIAETPYIPMAITSEGEICSMIPFYVYDGEQENANTNPDDYIYISQHSVDRLNNTKKIAYFYGYDMGVNDYVAFYMDGRVGSLTGSDDVPWYYFEGESFLQVAVDVRRGVVGIRSDGSLVSSGEFGQELDKWKGIVAVDMNASDVVGITKDGHVKTTNESINQQTKKWENIIAISIDRNIIVGLKKDGTVVAASASNGYDDMLEQIERWENIVAVDVCPDGSIIGVHGDKSVEFVHGYIQ